MPRWQTVKFPMDLSDRASEDYRSGPVTVTPMTADDYARMEATTMAQGTRLTVEQVTAIQRRWKEGGTVRDIARAVGVSEYAVRRYRTGGDQRTDTAAAWEDDTRAPSPDPWVGIFPMIPVSMAVLSDPWDPDVPPTGFESRGLADMLMACGGCAARVPVRDLRVLRWSMDGAPATLQLCPSCRAQIAS